MFRAVPLSIIGSLSLYTQQWYMSYRFADCLRAGSGRNCSIPSWSCSQAVSKPVWHIPLLRVQWKTPDDGQRNCPKHVEIYSRNKFEKLVHLVGFIIRIYRNAWSPERQIQGLWVVADFVLVTSGKDLVNFKKENVSWNMLIVKRCSMDISGCIL